MPHERPDELVRLPDGRAVQLWQGGDPRGVPVLFLHGTPDCRLAAVPGDAAARAAGVRLVAANRPGYGRSDPAPSDHLSVADDTAAVAAALGLDEFAVLGMSLGGQYALACAARDPARVVAAGVVAAPAVVPELEPPLPRDGLDEAGEAFFHRLAAGSVEDNIASTRDDFRSYVEHVDPGDGDDAALLARVEASLHPADAAALATVDDALRAAAVREALAQPDGYLRDAAVAFRRWPFRVENVRCPTWLWYGALDPQAAVRNGVWLADRIPDATFVVREEEAHLSPLLGHWPEILTTLARAAGA